jgi:VanZ family protein
MKPWILRWGPAAIVIGIIFVASSTPGSNLPDLGYMDYLAKKGGHLLGYALLGAAALHALRGRGPSPGPGIILSGLLVILHAVFDEWHQKFTPGRTSSAIDVCIDTVGGLIGIACFFLLQKFFRDRAHKRGR